ncbi:MAG TPA: ferritin-like domain-containing protein [Jatrophihabitans sp.]|nr:ferritin-like domain-containing protein [Jatrophihabitans sp.]
MTAAIPPGDPVTSALLQVLEWEHAAVYGYPVIGVTLTDADQVEHARTAEAAHRLVRDALSQQLVSRLAVPTAAQPRYQPPAPVTDDASAQDWALQLEQSCAAGYRQLLASTAGDTPAGRKAAGSGVRQQALTGLNTAATQAAYWRALLHPDAPTVAFPGL